MVNSREELIDRINGIENYKYKSLILKFAKIGIFDGLIGKTNEELKGMMSDLLRGGSNNGK